MTPHALGATINIGTILLEPARWARPKRATYSVVDWVHRFAEAGFDGMELWEDHADSGALAAEFPVAVYNTYCGFEDGEADSRATALQQIHACGARAVKFNVGGEESRGAEYRRNLEAWVRDLPDSCRALCECHAGTVVETPAAARAFLDSAEVECGVIVHAFADSDERLQEWLRLFGAAVELVHVQLRDGDGRFLRLDEAPELARRRIDTLAAAGFSGAYTLEFTKGTPPNDDTPESMWREALRDLAFLREQG